MVTVENLVVKVTYHVGLIDVEMPENVYEQLLKASYDNGGYIDAINRDYADAAEWIADNISEKDCMEWEAEVFDITD